VASSFLGATQSWPPSAQPDRNVGKKLTATQTAIIRPKLHIWIVRATRPLRYCPGNILGSILDIA
ncbi:uncharacterized protein METZ01_LOCUS438116, partial [marine metagenome]